MTEPELTLKDLANLIKNVKADLSEQINDINNRLDEKFSNAICDMKKDIVAISSRQDYLEENYERIDRHLHLTDLMVHGIPKSKEDNIRDILQTIGAKIGFSHVESTVLSTFRCKQFSEKPTIIVKFSSSSARNIFYKHYKETLKTKALALRDIGIPSDNRIIIQESLSRTNAALFRKAMELKRDQSIHAVFTYNGFVKITPTRDSTAVLITSIQQLLEIARKNVTSQSKRKFNNSGRSDSSPVENDPKIAKSSGFNNQRCTASSSPNAIFSSESSVDASSSTNILQNHRQFDHLNRTELSRPRKNSSGTLDEFFIKK